MIQAPKMPVFLSKFERNFKANGDCLSRKWQGNGFFLQKTHISTWRGKKNLNCTNEKLRTQSLILDCWRPQEFSTWCLLIWFHAQLTSTVAIIKYSVYVYNTELRKHGSAQGLSLFYRVNCFLIFFLIICLSGRENLQISKTLTIFL